MNFSIRMDVKDPQLEGKFCMYFRFHIRLCYETDTILQQKVFGFLNFPSLFCQESHDT